MENKINNQKLKSLHNINKMPKIGKRQQAKIRKDTENLLNQIGKKFNSRTYNTYLGEIRTKRIDAVQRLAEQFDILKDSVDKNITKKTFKNSIDKASGLKEVRDFNRTGNDTKITNLSPNKLKRILSNLDIKNKIILQANGTYFIVRSDKLNKMIENINDFWINETQEDGSDVQLIQKVRDLNEITLSRPKSFGKDHNEGAFFPYYNKTEIDLTDFQIFKNRQEADYDENCFVYAIRQSGVLTEEELSSLKSMCIGLYIPTNKITQICEKFNLYIRIKHTNHQTTKNYGNKTNKEIILGLIDKHYFIVTTIPYTLYSIKNYQLINELEDYNKIYKERIVNDKKYYKKDEKRYTDSWEAIKYMFETKEEYLTPIPYQDITATQYYNEASEILDLNYAEMNVKENKITKMKDKSENSKIIFFDFETITNEEIHKPYMVSSSETETFYGENCGLKLLRKLTEEFYDDEVKTKLILIAHNCGYDFRFIQQYLNMTSLCERGHNLLEGKGLFYYSKGKSIEVILKDSYSIITMPLRNFGKAFNLEQEKEILPYNLYTKHNIDIKYIDIKTCKIYCDLQVRCNNIERIPSKKDYDDYFNKFLENCSKWKCLKEGFIDIIEYSKIYCEKDVEVLKLGYEKFGKLLKESCNLNVIDFMSSAQLAHQYMTEQGVFEDVYQVSSIPRDYIMKCMVGGRTMCKNNKKQYVKDRLQDFDAVSLYPSAMERLGGYLKGKPKVLNAGCCPRTTNTEGAETGFCYEFLKKCDGYFVQIKIKKVNKNYNFPLMSYVNDEGVRIFTNEPPNNLYVCKFDLEDLIKFHKIEFEIIDGYYFDEGRNNKLRDVIKHVFNERLKMKKQKNALEQIYKLIMNSAYGKTLQKSHSEQIHFKNENDIDKFIDKNYNYIKTYEELYSKGSFKKYIVKMEKGIEEHFNNCHCGVEVLAMSKRIMNEVMCLAEDNELDIYYQDTDSMHIKECDIKILSKKYEEKYDRELIGKGMGQFHSDFDSDIIKENIHATESIFLGKKCYIDKLEGEDEYGNHVVDYHIRMKGVSNNAIKHKSKIEERDFMDIYKSLHKGNEERFDLCCGGEKVNFEYNSNYTITTKKEFPRTLSFV